MILKLNNRHLVFVHPPRSSGTSIEHCLLSGALVPDGDKHLNAKQIRYTLGEDSWRSSFKFGIVRSPWERMASLYVTQETPYASYNLNAGKSMMEFLSQYKPAPWEHGVQCSDYINEELDLIIRFEERENGILQVNKQLEEFGLCIDPSVKKRSHTKQRKDIDYYDEESKQWMLEKFEDDFLRWYS